MVTVFPFLLLTAAVSAFKILHITDVHVDPHYVVGSIAGSGCYCDTHDSCARYPATCVSTTNVSEQAGPFGSPQNDCATPPSLWESAMQYVALEHADAKYAFFTGDFGDAGLTAPCDPSGGTAEAQAQIVGIVAQGMAAVRAVLPNATVYGCGGNHDNVPGDVAYGSEEMQWLYGSWAGATGVFGASFPNDTAAQDSLRSYGWYATAMEPGLAVIALNTNYWTTLNPLLTNTSSESYALGQLQFEWLNTTLASLAAGEGAPIATSADSAAAAAGTAAVAQPWNAYVIGHIPPHSGAWVSGFYTRYRQIMSSYPSVVLASFWGHDHVDTLSLLRSCPNTNTSGGGGGNSSDVQWEVTRGINWCSGGDWPVGDVWGQGLFQNSSHCPLLPAAAGGNESIAAGLCEGVCGPENTTCKGFTYYPQVMAAPYGTCCFRTDCSQKPANASSPAVCYEKVTPQPCDSNSNTSVALHVQYGAPSLTEGYPPGNPTLRTYTAADAADAGQVQPFTVTDVLTYWANITAANDEWALTWRLEYSARDAFALPDLSAGSWEAAIAAMTPSGAPSWSAYTLYNAKSYDGPGAQPVCSEGPCKSIALSWLNGTGLPGAETVVSK